MTDVHQDLKALEELRKESDSKEGEAKSKSREVSDLGQKIRERVLSGESTGDLIRDFVIVTHYGPNEPVEAAYRAIEASLQGRQGELILVIEIDEEPMRHSFIGGPSDFVPIEKLFLGVLSGEALEIEMAEHSAFCKLPVSQAVTGSWTGRGIITVGHIDISDYGTSLGKHLSCDRAHSTRKGYRPRREIIVGDGAIRAWLSACLEESFHQKDLLLGFAALAEAVGKPLSEGEYPLLAEERRNRHTAIRRGVLLYYGLLLAKESEDFRGRLDYVSRSDLEANLRVALRAAKGEGLLDSPEPFLDLNALYEQYGRDPAA